MNHRPELFHRESFSQSELSQGEEQGAGKPGAQAAWGQGRGEAVVLLTSHLPCPRAAVLPGEHGDLEAKAGRVPTLESLYEFYLFIVVRKDI